MKLSWKWSCLALVSDTGVKSVMSTVAVKVNFLRKTDVERVVAHVEAVELTREIRVPDVVDLRNSGQRRFGRYVRSGVFSSGHHGHGTNCQIFKEKFNWIESKFQGIPLERNVQKMNEILGDFPFSGIFELLPYRHDPPDSSNEKSSQWQRCRSGD